MNTAVRSTPREDDAIPYISEPGPIREDSVGTRMIAGGRSQVH
jgi:hypothetical protein